MSLPSQQSQNDYSCVSGGTIVPDRCTVQNCTARVWTIMVITTRITVCVGVGYRDHGVHKDFDRSYWSSAHSCVQRWPHVQRIL